MDVRRDQRAALAPYEPRSVCRGSQTTLGGHRCRSRAAKVDHLPDGPDWVSPAPVSTARAALAAHATTAAASDAPGSVATPMVTRRVNV